MKLFLKVISFPIRFVLFLVVALITGIVAFLNNTVGMFLVVAASIVAFIGTLMTGLAVISAIVWIILILTGKAANMAENIPYLLICTAGIVVVSILLMFMPVLAGKIYSFFLTVTDWLWALALTILKCDPDELKYY